MRTIVKHLSYIRKSPHWNDWRWQWRQRFSMLEMGGYASPFRAATTPYYLNLADFSSPDCPILKQILPDAQELNDMLFSLKDPLAEEAHMPVPGLVHRYPDRVLWYVSSNCAAHCRFCTRRRKVGIRGSAPARAEREAGFKYIENNRNIKEVILSGGDPLALSNRTIESILGRLRAISHLYSIRIHTRLPVTLPMRITEDLLEIFRSNYPLTIVTHFNHPFEITSESRECIRALRMNGVLILNQSVLLAGINDTVEEQERLNLGLISAGVKPYYLHQCDEVSGVSHFRVPLDRGLLIQKELRGRNPGISLPRYMIDLPGGGGKIPMENDYRKPVDTQNKEKSRYSLLNWAGEEYTIID